MLIAVDGSEKTIETADYFWIDIGNDEWIDFADRPDVTPDHPGENDGPHLAFRATEDEISAIEQWVAHRGLGNHEPQTSIYLHNPDDNYLELPDWCGPNQSVLPSPS